MEEVQEISISGAVLASILTQMVTSSSEMEGLLFGSVQHRDIGTITDHSDTLARRHGRAHIAGFVVTHAHQLYSSDGSITVAEFDRVINSRKDTLLGWFRFRRLSSLQISYREQLVHTHLTNLMRSRHQFSSRPIFGCFTSNIEANNSTLGYIYRFFQMLDSSLPNKTKFASKPVTVVNIDQLSIKQYIPADHLPPITSNTALQSLAQQVSLFSQGDELATASTSTKLCRALLAQIKDLSNHVARGEDEISKLETAIAKYTDGSPAL